MAVCPSASLDKRKRTLKKAMAAILDGTGLLFCSRQSSRKEILCLAVLDISRVHN